MSDSAASTWRERLRGRTVKLDPAARRRRRVPGSAERIAGHLAARALEDKLSAEHPAAQGVDDA